MKSKKKETSSQEEIQPKWYHYIIILVIIAGLITSAYFVFELFVDSSAVEQNSTYSQENEKEYYKYKRGNVTYNIQLTGSEEKIKSANYTITPSQIDVLNTQSFTFSFDKYNGTDNGEVSLSAIKLRRFLSRVFFFNFDANESFVETNTTTCANATKSHKIVLFKPYSNVSGVFEEEPGCYVVRSQNPENMPLIIDRFIIEITSENNELR